VRIKILFFILLLAAACAYPVCAESGQEALVKLSPDHQAGLELMVKGDLAGAEGKIKSVIEADPKNFYAHNDLGVVYGKMKKYDEAKAEFEKALAINPSYRQTIENKELLKKKTGEKESDERATVAVSVIAALLMAGCIIIIGVEIWKNIKKKK
jgi:tetratricopeptide (TPR) repeat protein